ncbi:tRNA uridine-5-carboxymethylaminomethyl(34) synthesis GTPase MnmE [Fundidesulfovibrio butyratiphilus]
MSAHSDTIAAIATPPGFGGVGVVRVSGADSQTLAIRLFRSARPDFAGFRPSVLHHGTLVDADDRPLDDVLAVFMPGPNSYTGEDTFELHCHGSPAVLEAALAACFALGARPARAGEFTRRAFLAGKLDLTQAQAVAELAASATRQEAALALTRLEGLMGRRVRDLRARLESLRQNVCLAVDFPEDDVECLDPEAFAAEVESVAKRVDELARTHRQAKPFREGMLAVLAGPVNAGKSSLLNALLGRERAIVSHQPGTTRDFLEERLDLSGLPVRLADTAGLRVASDAVERSGVAMSRKLMDEADLVLVVADGSLDFPDHGLSGEDGPLSLDPARTLGVVSKADLPRARRDPAQALAGLGIETVAVSSRTGQGLDALTERMRARLLAGRDLPGDDQPAPNAREAALLEEAGRELDALLQETRSGLPPDLLGVRLESACQNLAAITGEITSQDVLDSIFSRFCIGK